LTFEVQDSTASTVKINIVCSTVIHLVSAQTWP